MKRSPNALDRELDLENFVTMAVMSQKSTRDPCDAFDGVSGQILNTFRSCESDKICEEDSSLNSGGLA